LTVRIYVPTRKILPLSISDIVLNFAKIFYYTSNKKQHVRLELPQSPMDARVDTYSFTGVSAEDFVFIASGRKLSVTCYKYQYLL